jgi:hypothetical protein
MRIKALEEIEALKKHDAALIHKLVLENLRLRGIRPREDKNRQDLKIGRAMVKRDEQKNRDPPALRSAAKKGGSPTLRSAVKKDDQPALRSAAKKGDPGNFRFWICDFGL